MTPSGATPRVAKVTPVLLPAKHVVRIPHEFRRDRCWTVDQRRYELAGLAHILCSDTPLEPVAIQPVPECPQRVNRLERVVGVAIR